MNNRTRRRLNSTSRYNIVLLIVLVFFVGLFTMANPDFLSAFNVNLLFRQNLPNIIIGCAMMFVITSGAIDLSVGGVMALSAITYAAICVAGVDPWLAIVIVAFLGVLIGVINTVIIEVLKVPAFMATIAGWLIYGGLAFVVCGGPNPISKPSMQVITILDQIKLFKSGQFWIQLAIPISILVVLIFFFLEKKTKLGKYAIAIGGNFNAAYYSGVNVTKMRLIFFILSSVMAALSGVWQVARLSTADPRCIGLGVEFAVLSACIVGGVNIKGGQGSILGVVMGVLLLGVLILGIPMSWKSDIPSFLRWIKSPYLTQVLIGGVMLIVVFINFLVSRGKNYD